MKLTDKACKNAKPKDMPYKLSDGGGLHLYVKTNGTKLWRMKYRWLGKEKTLSFGAYPLFTLGEAREAAKTAKKTLASGTDPMQAKKNDQRKSLLNQQNTFESVALEWHENKRGGWSDDHAQNILRRMQVDVFPYIGNRPISDIDAPELLEALRKVEKRGALDIAQRVRNLTGQVFRYGIATGRCKRDHAADLKGALKVQKTKHFAALEMKEMPELLQKLEKNDARLFAGTIRATKLLMHTFVRTKELICAKWDEFDLDNAEWRIPAERMKMRRPHIVPLSRQSVELLKAQRKDTEHLNSDWVFPSPIRPKQHMSNNTILFALGRLGYKGRMTGHGFRALARTTLRETLNYDADVIERQLAHKASGSLGEAYDRTQFLKQRRSMMQDWSNYLEDVARTGKVISVNFPRKSA